VGHVTIFSYDLEALDGFDITDDVVEIDRSVLFDPGKKRLISNRFICKSK
jgi:hypothetical protein